MTNTNPMTIYRTHGRKLSIAALATVAGLWAAPPGAANPAATDAETGQRIFQEKCAACHTVGGGDLVGPDLKGVTAQRPREWLQRWIAAPDEMLAAGDPVATALLHRFHEVPMPNSHLNAPDIAAVLAYLATSAPGAAMAPATGAVAGREESTPALGSGGAATAAVGTTTALAAGTSIAAVGDPEIGKELFTGAARFRNGGPPCMACHSVAGIGALGGGQLGPDLTTVVTRLGGVAALRAFVGGSPTPTMSAIWSRTPITTGERDDVVAFLAQAALFQRPAQAMWQLAGLSALGLVILLAIIGWVWRGRLRDGVRRPMIAKQRKARS
ncbi:MAG: c-type cytochrome [Burkholderiales bacterium]|nr:c-type cytochrome [Burkholderiales bacterium]